MEVISSRDMPIRSEDDVVLARRAAREIAQERGFDVFGAAALTTATSELTRNALVHAGEGVATIEEVRDGERRGVRVTVRDRGPGIADLERALRGGFSTARSLGLGLSGSKRLVDEFLVEATIGQGTVVVIVKWARF